MNKNNVMIVVLMLIVGVGAFAGGMKYQQGKIPQFSDRFGQFGSNRTMMGNGQGLVNGNQTGTGQRRMGNGQIVGEIMSVDEKTITVKMTDGSSKIVLLNDSTAVSKSAEAQKSELKVGVKVAVFGTPNTDGSVTGSNIELNPALLGQMTKLTGTPTKTN
jgi:hypothetical protein